MILFWFVGALVTALFGMFLFVQENPHYLPDKLYAQVTWLFFISLLFWPILLLSMIHQVTEGEK